MLCFRLQRQANVNPADDQHVVLKLHLTHGFRNQPPQRRIDLTRLQRASKGSGKSTSRRRDYVVQRAGMRLRHRRRNFIVFGNCAMHAEDDRLRLSGQIGFPNWSYDSFNANFRSVHYVRHMGKCIKNV